MRLHMLGLPHTRTRDEFSHCAFTGKVRRWGKMMQPYGYECIHYGVGTPDSPGWFDTASIMSPEEQEMILGYDPAKVGSTFIGNDANVAHPVYKEFNRRLRVALLDTFRPGDIICAPFGHGHKAAFSHPSLEPFVVETGIGYPTCCSAYRIYESYSWLAQHAAWENRQPWDSEWVVPNYFDLKEWPLRSRPAGEGEFILFMGRLHPVKGLNEIRAIARAMPNEQFMICGQGDPTPWVKDTPNLIYHPPVHGMQRAELMHRSKGMLMPSRMVEPFGGVAVEAMLTGTPVLTTDFGAFSETIPYAGWRCHTLSRFLQQIRLLHTWDAGAIQAYAASKYSLDSCGAQYDAIFQMIPKMWKYGWSA